MSDVYIGFITMFAGNYAPQGYALCDGSFLPISQYPALYDIIGTTYGSNGSNFALPDLRGRAPMHFGQGTNLSNYVQGQSAGAETVMLNTTQIPSHTHSLGVFNANATASDPLNASPARSRVSTLYGTGTPTAILGSTAVTNNGGFAAHNNIQPSLAISFIIALQGLYPPKPS